MKFQYDTRYKRHICLVIRVNIYDVQKSPKGRDFVQILYYKLYVGAKQFRSSLHVNVIISK